MAASLPELSPRRAAEHQRPKDDYSYEEEEDDDDEYDDDDDDDDDIVEEEEEGEKNMGDLVRLMSSGTVPLRVHDVVIRGNARRRDSLIEAEVGDLFRSVNSIQDLIRAAETANSRLRKLEVFDSVSITLDSGPPDAPNTAVIVIDVVETESLVVGCLGVFAQPSDTKGWSLELSPKLRNLLGFGDEWDVSASSGWNQKTEISAGVLLPRFKAIRIPLMARVSVLTEDLLKLDSYKNQLLRFSVGLISTRYHDLAYNLTWRMLSNPSSKPSESIKRHLGHSLLHSLKYTYKIDQRDSLLRPTSGFAFRSTTEVGGFGDSRLLRFVRQELDMRGALPLGFYKAALNFGVAAGIIMPWGRGLTNPFSHTCDPVHMGGHSIVGGLGGPGSLLGFKLGDLGPADARRLIPNNSDVDESDLSPGRNVLGGHLAITAFADLSFDFPSKLLRESGIHGHTFLYAGKHVRLTGNQDKRYSFQEFFSSFRSSVGLGIVIPTKFFRMEINYCFNLKQLQRDCGKAGIQVNFSSLL